MLELLRVTIQEIRQSAAKPLYRGRFNDYPLGEYKPNGLEVLHFI